jgi:hypothetical protein
VGTATGSDKVSRPVCNHLSFEAWAKAFATYHASAGTSTAAKTVRNESKGEETLPEHDVVKWPFGATIADLRARETEAVAIRQDREKTLALMTAAAEAQATAADAAIKTAREKKIAEITSAAREAEGGRS